jgi:adenine/guanine phosphoribosyltransferase-like PRPP-binding protein
MGRPHVPNYSRTVSHLQDFINPLTAKTVVERCVRFLQQWEAKGNTFTTIAVRGLSGLLIAPMVAAELGKTLLVVRKVERTGHGSSPVEGDISAQNYIILDDFIDSGKTVRTIMEAIEEATNGGATCVGTLQAYYFLRPLSAEWFSHGNTMFDTAVSDNVHAELLEARRREEERRRAIRATREAQLETYVKSSADGSLWDRREMALSLREARQLLDKWDSKFPALPEYKSAERLPYKVTDGGEPCTTTNKQLPATKGLSPLKKYLERERQRLAKRASDRANFNAVIPTGPRQSSPRITASSLRNISR